MPDRPVPTELEKTPTSDISVNKPESGTYGEKVDLSRLRQSLPPMGPPGSDGTAAAAPPAGVRPGELNRPTGRPKNGPSGVPGSLLSPTQRPGVPLDQPLARAPAPQPPRAQAANEQRLLILDQLTSHPEVSSDTREWARLVRDAIIESGR